jgi:periplasmic divalent cation tolerance protein
MKHLFVYITTANRQEAEAISEIIIRERLVACTNIIDGMTALFHWNDAVQKEEEAVLIAKTTVSVFPRLEERVRKIHSYDCPCIIALPIAHGNPGYLDWIDQEVHDNSSSDNI